MLKNELKAALAILGTVFVPVFAQADQSMSYSNNTGSSSSQQAPAFYAGEEIRDNQTPMIPAAYPASAAYVCNDGYDFALSGEWLYYKWNQDMSVGTLVDQTAGITNGYNGHSERVNFNPGYASGFAVALALNTPDMDSWSWGAKYRWYNNNSSRTVTATSARKLVVNVRNDQDLIGEDYFSGSLTSHAKMNFQNVDGAIARDFYIGKQLTLNVGSALTGQWITQKFSSSGTLTAGTDVLSSISSEQKTWALGPKLLFEPTFMLGWGFSVLSKVHLSALYTNYKTTAGLAGSVAGTGFSGSYTGLDNVGTLVPATELNLSLAWGSYFCDQSFHVDIVAGWDFNAYLGYNKLADRNTNLILQGFNLGVQFDF